MPIENNPGFDVWRGKTPDTRELHSDLWIEPDKGDKDEKRPTAKGSGLHYYGPGFDKAEQKEAAGLLVASNQAEALKIISENPEVVVRFFQPDKSARLEIKETGRTVLVKTPFGQQEKALIEVVEVGLGPIAFAVKKEAIDLEALR